jgi:ribonuclease HII
MRHAVIELTNCDFVLVDGYSIPNLKGFDQTKQTAIIKGDTQSLSIAAASVLAKVYRDDLMSQLHPDFTPYHWHTNKGYGTRSHCQAILDHGLTKHHRLDFVRNLLKQKGASQTNS